MTEWVWPQAFVAALTVVLLACGHDSTSPAASTVSIASGDTQKVFVGGSAAQPLVVLLAGADGAPLSGEMVTWAVTSGGGSLNPVTSTTDDSGHARTTYISADSADTAIVTATAAQGSAKFRIVVVADTTGTLTATDGDGTAVLVGYQISLVVQARDQFGSAVPGRNPSRHNEHHRLERPGDDRVHGGAGDGEIHGRGDGEWLHAGELYREWSLRREQ